MKLEDGNVFGLGNPSSEEESIWHWLAMDKSKNQLYPSLLIAHNKVTFNVEDIPESFAQFKTLDATTWEFEATVTDGPTTTVIIDPAAETQLNAEIATTISNLVDHDDSRCVFA